MSQGRKGKLNYRCPSCFMRDLDIDMFYDSIQAVKRMYLKKTKWCVSATARWRRGLRSLILTKTII